uniref:G_PROTEIN_RECEP_F1_2 domain-containing protein n=1 Tax=Ascaris lumbricoides TaxID=6252 RepID=A0A0M3ISP3_ASCLU
MDYFSLIGFNMLPVIALLLLNTKLVITLHKIYYRFMDYFSLIGFNMLPVIALLLLNTKLVITLHKVIDQDVARVNSQITHIESYGMRSLTVQRFNANAMLFAVVLLLLICVGPQVPARLLFDYYGQYHETAVLYTCVSQQLVFLNASLNFCLYCLVSRKYRSLLQQTIKRFFDKARRYDSSMALRRFGKKSSQQRTTISDDMHISSKKTTQPFSAIPLLRQH